MIRRAIPRDIPALVGLALRCIRDLDVGDLVVSPARVEATARRLVSDPSGLVLVDDGIGISAVIAVAVSDGHFFERKAAGIIFWYSETPGSGYRLLREAMNWARGRPAVKAIGLSQDFGGDVRIAKVMTRAGLKVRGSVSARY